MNCQDGDSSVRGSAQLGMTPSVLISAMNVMNSDAPSSAPRMGRNESDRNSNSESSHANLPRGPFARSAALMAAASWGCRRRAHARQCHDVVVDVLHAAADDDLVPITGLRDGAHHAGDRLDDRLLHARRIAQLEPQPCGAVREAFDIGCSANALNDLGGRVRRHGPSPLICPRPERWPAKVMLSPGGAVRGELARVAVPLVGFGPHLRPYLAFHRRRRVEPHRDDDQFARTERVQSELLLIEFLDVMERPQGGVGGHVLSRRPADLDLVVGGRPR